MIIPSIPKVIRPEKNTLIDVVLKKNFIKNLSLECNTEGCKMMAFKCVHSKVFPNSEGAANLCRVCYFRWNTANKSNSMSNVSVQVTDPHFTYF